MQNTTKTILAVIAIIIIIGAVWYIVSGKSAEPTLETEAAFKIGIITPLTGEAAAWGNWVKNSIELASQEASYSPIELIYEDSMCDPKTGVNAYSKLKNIDEVDLITGFVCSSVALAVAPLAEGDGITMITTGASATDLRDAGKHIFNMWPLNDAQATFVADYLTENGVKKAAVLYVNNDFGLTMKESFEEKFTKQGGEIVKIETIEQTATDARTQLVKLKQADPEYVFLATYYENAGFALKQNKELGYGLNFIGSIDTYNQQTKEIAQEAIIGYKYSKPLTSEPGVYEAYVKKYKASYGEKPDLPGEAAYDTTHLIQKALENKVGIEEYLLGTKDYLGASGRFSIDKKGNIIKKFKIVEVTE